MMPSQHKKPGVAFWATVVVVAALVALLVYSSAYFAMVQPRKEVPVIGFSAADPIPVVADYPGEHFWNRIFTPIHWLDRKIRPAKWAPVLPEGIR